MSFVHEYLEGHIIGLTSILLQLVIIAILLKFHVDNRNHIGIAQELARNSQEREKQTQDNMRGLIMAFPAIIERTEK